MGDMKPILFILTLILLCSASSKAQVASFYWDHSSSPHTFYDRMQLGYGNQIKHIDQFFNGDTLFVDLIFTDCAAPAASYIWDSLIDIPSSISTPQYHFFVAMPLTRIPSLTTIALSTRAGMIPFIPISYLSG